MFLFNSGEEVIFTQYFVPRLIWVLGVTEAHMAPSRWVSTSKWPVSTFRGSYGYRKMSETVPGSRMSSWNHCGGTEHRLKAFESSTSPLQSRDKILCSWQLLNKNISIWRANSHWAARYPEIILYFMHVLLHCVCIDFACMMVICHPLSEIGTLILHLKSRVMKF